MKIQLFKYPDIQHYQWPVVILGEDSEGRWYGAPKGTGWTKGDLTGSFHADLLCLVPYKDWWLAEFTRELEGIRIYVHICTPPVLFPDRIITVDLDLDVEVWPGGKATLLDEDEFEENAVSLGYPPDQVEDAIEIARKMMLRPPQQNDRWITTAVERWYPALEEAMVNEKRTL